MDITGLLIIAGKSIAIYVFILLAIRLFGKKELAQLSVIDLVFILLISNAVQNAMVGSDTTLQGGMAAAIGLFVVNYLMKYLNYYFPKFGKAVQGGSVMLVYQGEVLTKNLADAMISQDELLASIREHGVAGVAEVNLAILEADGNISVLSNEFQNKSVRKRKVHKALTKQQ
jgi:uncharacterized membrane protein YcaP (DUF421 family)